MLSWLKHRLRSEQPAARAGAVTPSDSKPAPAGRFALEALEPRVLLSGDTPFAEVYRTLVNDDKDGQRADADVCVQQLDAETSAEIAAATGSDFGGTQPQTTVKVAWSESWQATASTDSTATEDTSGDDKSGASVASAAPQNGTAATLLEQAASGPVSPEISQAEGETLSADSGDQDDSSDIPSSELPRGPPANEQPAAVVIAADSIEINNLGLSDSSVADEGEAFGVQFLLVSEVPEDGLPRGPPAIEALSYQALAPILDEAIRLWTSSGLSPELAGRLASMQVQITDLANGELGEAHQNSINLDSTAAGRGWFVDPTPGDNAEFAFTISDLKIAAVAGSLAYGRIDLLTVLVHEIGHVLGFDHAVGLAVMNGNLDPGQRVLLGGDASALLAGLDGSHFGAQETSSLVVVDKVDLAIQAFADAKALLADIQAAATQELPLIGMSLNQLLLDTGFDLFGEFAAAVAPVAGAVAELGTLTQRFAELEELLEDAFLFADLGGDAAYDNPEIELSYDAVDDILDMVFAFELADTDQFVLDDIDLTWDLGVAFTLGVDFTELIADPDTGLELTLALTGSAIVDTAVFDAAGEGSVELDLLEMLGGSAPSVALEVTGNLNLGDAIYLEGTFGFERRTGESLMLADGATATALTNVSYTLVSGEGVAGFFGANGPYIDQAITPDAVGLSISGVDFSLLLLADGGFDYTALTTSGGSASFVGVPDLVIGASAISVALNSTSDTTHPNKVLDFNDGASDSVAGVAVLPAVGPALEFEGEDGAVLDVSGDFALDAFGFVVLAGTFNLVKQTDLLIDDGAGAVANFNADVLSLSLTASGFVGSGASLSQDPLTDASTVTVVTTGAVGFNVPTATLDLVILQDTATPANKYTGLQVALTNAGLAGIDELGLTVSGTVQVNKGPVAGRLDWSEVTGTGKELPGVTLEMDQTVELAIRNGSVALDAFGFVQLTGTFNLVKQTNVAIDDGAAPVAAFNADVLSLTITASGFAGAGGSLSAANLSTASVVAGDIGFSLPSGSLDLVLVKDRATTNKYTGLQVGLANAGLVGITDLALTVSGQVQVNKGPAAGRLDWTQVTGTGKELPGVTLAMDQTVDLAIRNGSVALDAFGFVQLAGTFSLVKRTNVAIDDGAAPVAAFNADVLSLSITASGFAGAGGALSAANNSLATVTVGTGAIGFSLPSGSLDLVLVKDRAVAANKYTGLQIGVTNAGLVGIDQLGITVSGQVQINKGPAAGRLDWLQVTGTGKELPAVTLTMDQTVEFAIRNGSLALDAFGFVVLAGTFNMVKQTNVAIDDGNLAAFNADVLSLSITASGFAGIGGSLSAANNSLATVGTGAGAVGFSVPSGSLELVLVKDRATAANKYTGLQVGLTNATLAGMPSGFGLTVSGTVQVNKGPATGGRLDWTQVTGTGKELPTVTLAMDETVELAASGTVSLDVFGFVQVFGNFALAKYSTTVTLAGQTTATSVDVLTFGMDDVDVFVGAGPYFNTDGTLHADSANAVGLLLEDTSLALALFTRTAGPGSGSYYAVRAFAADFVPLGLGFGASDTFVLDASGYRIEINGGSAGAINFAAGVGATHEDFRVQTGPGDTQTFKYSTALQRVAVENATLIIGDYVYVSGGFSFTRQQAMPVELSGAGTDNVDVLAFGAGNVDIFVGSGPYFIEGSDDRDPNAIGLALENVSFGLLLMKSTSTPATKYTALMATADRVGLVGLDSLTLSAAGITVEYNSSNRSDNKVIDFSGAGDAYLLDTGNGELEIGYGSKVLRASVEEAELQIESNVFISGGLAFERGPSRQVQLTTGTAMVSAIDIGAQDLTMFFGVDGPYWTDLDNDGLVDETNDPLTNETNPDAVGFAITNANLAMTLLKPSSGTIKYLGLHATADQIGFVGIEGFQLEAAAVAVDLNLALGTGVTNITPVVNFASTYDEDERQALFDVFDTDNDDEVSVDELTAALGAGHGVTESLATVQELVDLLNIGGAPPDAVLYVTEVAAQLTSAFSSAHLAAIQAIDTDGDGDGKFDPVGYEIKTGSGYLYLAADSRQIHASADNVVLDVAEFLNVTGSVALDIGSRETVTIRTGIPASLGSQATAVVEMVNDAIDGLEDALADLKTAIQDAVDAAIESLRDEIDGLLDDVIDEVVDYLKDTFAGYVGSLADLSQAQLEAAIAAVTDLVTGSLNALAGTLTVDSLIDGLIDPIVTPIIAALPDLLKDPVGDLLDTLLAPIRDRINGEFAGTLAEALGGAVSRVAGSVSEAIEAALQAAAATATATFDAAVDQARAAIETAIAAKLNPQFDRISLELDKVLARATARLDPLFVRLHALTELEVGENFATIEGVEVEVTALGISNAAAFVGLPPPGGFDYSQPFADQVDDAIGLYIDGLDLALGIFKPILGKQLPTFTALKLHADDAGFSDGGNDIIELTAKGIDVELNLGGPIVQGAGGLFGNATIDFVTSFQGSGSDPDGYAIQTSTTGDPIYIDFAGGEIIRASIEHAELHISEFVHITGSLAFEKGTIATVAVTGGLTGPAVDAVLDELDLDPTDPLMAGLPWAGGETAELSFMTIGASNVHAFVGIDGPYWTDTDLDDVVDASELDSSAKGLWIQDFDFGMAIMKPTNVADFAKYFALKASANQVSIVGIEGVEVTADNLLVEVNQSTPSIYGLPLFPVVDFASTYQSERQALFELLAGGDGNLSVADLDAALGTGHGVTTAMTTVDQLMALLDVGGAPPDGTTADGILSVAELADRLTPAFHDAALALDADDDGKFDPAGYEVNTGGTPVYLDMDSSLIRAQGFLELNLFDTIYLTGSVAFELGPVQDVILSDAAATEKEVTTMTIGAANVTAFIGANGPYWTDVNGNHTVDTATELSSSAVGFHITDLDMGILVMASTDPADLGVYVAAKASVHSFGLVGIDAVDANGQFDIAINVGIGATGLDFNADVVDFVASFPVDATIVGDQLGFEVNTGDPTSPVVLDFDSLLLSLQLGGSVTIYSDVAKAHPVVKLNGLLLFEVDSTGLKAFVAAGLEFGPDIGRASDNKFFDMNALGALVINANGLAADIDVSVEIGGALDDLTLNAAAHARLVLNTTGEIQTITIPERYAGFLNGTVNLSGSALGEALTAQGGADIGALDSMTGGTLDDRFTAAVDGSGDLIFSISAAAPTMQSLFAGSYTAPGVASYTLATPGPYFAVGISAHLGIGDFMLEGRFGLIVSADGLQLLVEAKIEFFSVQLYVKGVANIVTASGSEGLVLDIQATLSADAFGMAGLFSFEADLQLKLNTRPGNSSTALDNFDAGVKRQSFRIEVTNADLTLLSIVHLHGSGFIEVIDGVFRMQVSLSGEFLSVVSVSASAFFSSEGEFEIILDGQITLGPDCFNIHGSAHLEVHYWDSNQKDPFGTGTKTLFVSGTLVIGAELFCIDIDLTLGVTYDGATGNITIRVGPVPVPGIAWYTVDLGWFGSYDVPYPTIEMKYQTFTIGTLKLGTPPPPPVLGQVDSSNGVLTLNVGSLAKRTVRQLLVSEIDESVIIEELGAGSVAGRKEIRVTMFGVAQVFHNVSEIQIGDMEDGDDLLSLDGSVTTKVTATLGSGVDRFLNEGSGLAVVNGGDGNDHLTGGSGVDELDGGPGLDYLIGGLGQDKINGGTGADFIIWAVGDGNDSPISGGADKDTLNIIGTSGSDQVTIGASGSGFVLIIGGATLTVTEVEAANIEAAGGSDTFTVNDLTGSALSLVNLQMGLDSAQDTVAVNGGTAGESFNVSVQTEQRKSGASATGDTTVVETAVNASVLRIEKNLGVRINVFDGSTTSGNDTVTLNALGGDDTVNVSTLMAGLATTITGGDDSDTFNVGLLSGTSGNLNSITTLLTISGNAPITGSDTINVYDNADTAGNTGTLTSTAITGLGMAGSIAYDTIEHLNIHLGSGGDTFTIQGTHAAETVLNTNAGADIVNVKAISGATTVNGGTGSDTFNVGSNAQGSAGTPVNNSGGTVDNIAAVLAVNGDDPTTGSDVLVVDDTGDLNANTGTLTGTTITGLDMGLGSIAYGTIEHLTISLGTGGNTFTIDGSHGSATGSSQEDTTVNTGSGADTVHLNGATDLLYVNGQAGADTVNVNGTGAASVSTLNGDGDGDVFNVAGMDGTVNVNGGAGDDGFNLGSDAPTLPAVPTNLVGSIDALNGLLTVNGGNGSDILNVDDSDPVANDKDGTLTSSTLRGLALEQGIDYAQVETLSIWLAAGDNTFTISSTHAGGTTVSTALGNDTVNVNGTSGILTINAEAGTDTINVGGTGLNSQTNISGQDGDDTFNLTLAGSIDTINGLIVVDGGANSDVINVDDSSNAANKAGTLKSSTLRGLEMEAGLDYSNAEDFNLWLGTGTDGLFIDSTQAGTTQVYSGNGNTTVNQRDDTIAIRSTGGVTTVHGQGGNDFFYVNVDSSAANDPTFFTQFKAAAAAAANEGVFNQLFTRTHANGLGAVLNLHGEGNSDQYTVNLAGQGQALVNVFDNGAPDNGVDSLIVNGADTVANLANQPDDTFLLRRTFVALLNDSNNDSAFDQVERVNYDENINARLIVNALGGDDKFVADDNSAITTLDGGEGDDTFQIGQVFGTLRDAFAGIASGDEFGTTPVIIGVITDPVSNAVIFDPTSFDPVTDVLSKPTIDAINAAILHQRNLGQALDGVAYVSSGVTHATTIFGGNGQDTFNVYHNKGTLRLEGEADNDTFIVRAFVTIDLSAQGETEVNGGAGTDTVNYAINAPVSVDGGSGFDKVVVLGTPFNDSFVVTSEGIFGAGLNVKFVNIESAELDALEGDDTIYILGTGEDIVTTVIGGLGDDTINVMGDVMKPIVSDDLLGRSGVITQGLTSGDADYNLVGVNGVATNVVSAAGGSKVNIAPTGDPLRVTEGGSLASYFISLVAPDATALGNAPVYLTVSAGVASSTDRSIGGAGVLVRIGNSGTFTNAVVLTFDGATASTVYEIQVQAVNDGAAEGPRMALVSHSINSANAEYDNLALIDVFVNVVDNDQAGLDIRHLSLDNDGYGNNSTQVLENGFGDIYSVVLTAAPAVGEVVTVTLTADAQITARSLLGNLEYLTFNHSNWMTAQTVAVAANDDGLDGIEISRITHVVTSTGAVYGNFPTTASSRISVSVYDDDTPGAIVQQTGGSTIVVEGGATDNYRVQLTGAPDSNVTLTLRTDTQTKLSGSGVVVVDEAGTHGYFEYTYAFNTGNWNQWANITVTADPAYVGNDDKLKAFATQDQNLDQIRGPLIIEGGVGAGVTRALEPPVMLPGETNDVSAAVFGDPNTVSALESNDIDVLNVFHTDNSDADTGRLFDRTTNEVGQLIANKGLALTGFEMGGDLTVEQGANGVSNPVYYGGGITYNAFEIVEVLLGKGNETLTIDDTGDHDEKDAAVTADNATITAIHGGGGADTITINNRGEGPLAVYGDTSEDGLRYSNNLPEASIHGTSFGNPGNDTINASATLEQGDAFVGIVIDGGPGNDTITGSQDDDHLAGSSGNDTIHAQAGNDHVYGDSSFNLDLMLFALDQVTPFDLTASEQLDKINAMFTVPVLALGGADTINGNEGDDIIFGDHGVIGQVNGTHRIESTGNMILLQTTTLTSGGADTIHGNDGNDFIFGGVGNDTIYGDLGSDLIFGDHGGVAGSAAINVNGDDIGIVDGAGVGNPNAKFIYTSNISAAADASAGNDTIYGGSLTVLDTDTGRNILLGQQGSDTIYGGGSDDNIYGGHNVANGTDAGDFIDGAAGNDVIVGDNGLIERTAAVTDPRFAVLQGQLLYDSNGLALVDGGVNWTNPSAVEARRVQLFDHDDSANNAGNFGDDTIAGGADDDVIFGELGADRIHGDGIVAAAGLVALTGTIANSDVGGDDYVEGNGGNDTIFGGLGQDDLIGGSSSLYNLSVIGMRPDGADTIHGGNGDMIARNTEGDGSHARDSDMILGDNGNIFRIVGIDSIANGAPAFNYDNYDALNKIVVRAAQLLDYTPGGPDLVQASLSSDRGAGDELHGESGDDFIYGMTGNDVLFGEGQDDDLIGGWGNDWISGGTGQDGVLGDDGRIFTSRNGLSEPLNGVAPVSQTQVTTPGNGLVAEINVAGKLNKRVDLTPYNVDPAVLPSELFDPAYADDIIYGGLGDDFLHGGSGDDAISGAEAMTTFYTAPVNNGNVLQFNTVTGEFAAYNEKQALRQISGFLLNFSANEGVALGGGIFSDGDDQIFGDLGNDWLVGGTGRDHLWGGWGNDLLNADDDLGTNGGLNNAPDTQASYEDIAFGGAGRDRLIANTAGDRLVDWAGEFNSYLVPFNPFGVGTVTRGISPGIPEFLYALSKADGADQTLGTDSTRNGEPFGEIGLVKQGDAAFGAQTGGPDDPQPGSGGGKK